jgi:nucleoside-diphosphate-sugar epimerase
MPENILITGMSGLIGGIAGHDLAKTYRVRALNRRPVAGFETVTADITDFTAIRPAFEGIDTVVHMAADLSDDDRRQMHVNIEGTYNVFEAARQAGVSRVVFGSSGAVQRAVEREEPFKAMVEARLNDIPSPRPLLTHLDPARPDDIYGATKLFGEALGRSYMERYGMAVICIRIGRVREEDRPANAREAAVYLSHRDIAQAVRKSVEASANVRFDIVYAVSDNFTRFRDISHAKQVIGFVPQDGIKQWPLPEGWKAAR